MILQSSVQIPPFSGVEAARPPLAIQDVVLHHLRTEAEIACVLHLRDEIDLSVHTAAGPQFAALEKKETSAVSSSAFTWAARRSAPSASCPWATN